jgi:putative tryptophan/tyrosine transport system substrate-binding protein
MATHFGRREFIALAGSALAWPCVGHAQQGLKIPTVGVLWHAANAEEEGPYFRALLEGFRELGYVDGLNIKFEHRFPNEMPERFRSMAAELVSLNVGVLVSVGNVASPYAKNATTTIPIVFTLVADPVGMKLVESFARPGGNVTGLSTYSSDIVGRRLQLLKETIPGLTRLPSSSIRMRNPRACTSR